ncbi:MAG: iron-sulfur cluster assembly scaffold protein [Thermoproteota archaeon]|nr:iron-sulfur cluster assembly scaffold protein [Candidatus Brockarchaeota archaeon]
MSSQEDFMRELVRRFKNPPNYGEIENADIVSEEADYSCGDRVKLYFKIGGNRILEAKFTSEACLFCNASTSILLDLIKGKTIEEALSLKEEELLSIFKTDSKGPRYRCIILPLRALRKALKGLKLK